MDFITFASFYLIFILFLCPPFLLPVSPHSLFCCHESVSNITLAYRSTGYTAKKMSPPPPAAFRLQPPEEIGDDYQQGSLGWAQRDKSLFPTQAGCWGWPSTFRCQRFSELREEEMRSECNNHHSSFPGKKRKWETRNASQEKKAIQRRHFPGTKAASSSLYLCRSEVTTAGCRENPTLLVTVCLMTHWTKDWGLKRLLQRVWEQSTAGVPHQSPCSKQSSQLLSQNILFICKNPGKEPTLYPGILNSH